MGSIRERNNVTVFGEGRQPMVFAHGFGCDQNMWRFVTPALKENYRCVAFDYVGSGASDLDAYDPNRYGSLEGYAQDVLDVCTALGLSESIFVGHSVSGVIGMLAAIERPDLFDRLVLLCPSPRYVNDPPDYHGGFEREEIEDLLDVMDKNYIGWAHSFAPQVVQADRPDRVAEVDDSFCSTDPVVMRQFAEITFLGDNRDDVQDVPVPTLAIQCADDALVPPDVVSFVDENLPDGTTTVLDASGHCPHLTCPTKTVRAIQDGIGLAKASGAAPRT
jgi:sigma-B regulation protein RsbQ